MATFTQENALAEEPVGFMDRLRELRLPWIPVIVITVLVILAVFADVLSPHDPRAQNLRDARTPPFQTWDYPLGTDFVGKDILSRLIYGARTSAFISMFALGAGVVVGTVLGLISGYAGKWVDTIIMRIADATMGFPSILLAMIIVAILGTGLMPIVVAVAVSTWPRIARMIRGEVLSVKDADFVILAKIAGVSPTHHHLEARVPQRAEYADGDNQPVGGGGDTHRGVAEFPGTGPAAGRPCMGHHGL